MICQPNFTSIFDVAFYTRERQRAAGHLTGVALFCLINQIVPLMRSYSPKSLKNHWKIIGTISGQATGTLLFGRI